MKKLEWTTASFFGLGRPQMSESSLAQEGHEVVPLLVLWRQPERVHFDEKNLLGSVLFLKGLSPAI